MSVNSMMVDERSGKEMYETADGDKGLRGTRSSPSGQLEKLDRVIIRSLGPKGVITLMSKRGKGTLHVVKAGRSHQAQLVDVEEIVGEELPSTVGDAPIVRAGVSLISSIQLRTTHSNLTFEGPVGILFGVLGMVRGKNWRLVDTWMLVQVIQLGWENKITITDVLVPNLVEFSWNIVCEYRPYIVCLLKPRINGGIWLGWKDTIRVEVIQNHP
ncbi:hypothetical protein GOBAR_DD06305 [Gossypium barbadense]|nr:hypothetical protein GOBAR_DD06305 [Gossypium barbadense]